MHCILIIATIQPLFYSKCLIPHAKRVAEKTIHKNQKLAQIPSTFSLTPSRAPVLFFLCIIVAMMINSEKLSVGISCIFVVVMMLAGFGSSDIDQDRAQCADQLIGLAPCLSYVGGDKDAKTPTIDCCTGLKQVDAKSHKCLCVLIKDHDDPKLGLTINATLALNLPGACHVPVNITSCVDLLHLDPKSADGKMFLGYAEKTKAVNSTSASITSSGNSTTVAQDTSDGGSLGKGLLGIEMLFVTSMCFYISQLVF